MKEKNAAAVSLGRLGGIARTKALTAQQRSDIARKAVQARWEKRNRDEGQTDTK